MGERPPQKLLWRCNHVLRLASWMVPHGHERSGSGNGKEKSGIGVIFSWNLGG